MRGPRSAFVLGIAGGTGSGKTTVAARLALAVPAGATLVELDAYYCDHPELDLAARAALNYDHPDAFDWPLLLHHVAELRAGRAVEAPTYDFTSYERGAATTTLHPAPVVIVEGLLVLYEPALRELLDLKVFIDADADVRLIRRLTRDRRERGRSVESVIAQYLTTVRPSHLQFVEPTKRYADVIVPHGGRNQPAFDVLMARVREQLAGG